MKDLNLTLEEKIGQMIIFGINEENVTDRLVNMIKKHKIGGVILYKKNYKNYDDLVKLVNLLKEANKENKLPLFISIDQEGGRVNRMPSEFENIKSPAMLTKDGDIENVTKATNITSNILNLCGINMVYAPVLDIQRFGDNHAIGDRCYGKTEEEVCKFGIEAMKSFQSNNILSVVKHFPGHGATLVDSHFFLPTITTNISKLEKTDMLPFEVAVKEKADAIMVGHLLVKGINNYLPVSLSRKFIINYIRKKYRFKGLIITDDLKMKAIYFMYGANLAVRKAFEAGNDLIMMGIKETEVISAIKNIKKLVEQNAIKETRLDRSIKRIKHIKEKYKINDETVEKVLTEEIKNINNEIFDLNKKILINN